MTEEEYMTVSELGKVRAVIAAIHTTFWTGPNEHRTIVFNALSKWEEELFAKVRVMKVNEE